jgi:transcriptional regulator with XRE-family HTH domain
MSDKQSNDLDRALGRLIRLHRKLQGLSARELGERIGLTSQQIQKYELGENRVGFSRLVEIAAALECAVVELVKEAVGEQPAAGPDSPPEDVRQLIDVYGTLKPRHREMVLSLAAELSGVSD